MWSNSKNTIISNSKKRESSSSTQKTSAMSISLSAPPSDPQNSVFFNYTITKNVRKGSADLFSMNNWTLLINSQDVYPVQLTWPAGKRETVSTWASFFALFWSELDMTLTVSTVSLPNKSPPRIKPSWNVTSSQPWDSLTKTKILKRNSTLMKQYSLKELQNHLLTRQ